MSEIDISYSLSDSDELPGLYNTFAEAGFINNLFLSVNSTAIDKGNPAFPPDPDGSLPDLVAGSFDGPEAWNRYYVLDPGQTEAQFLMGIRSRSGVSFWSVIVGPGFEVIDPPTGPRNILSDGSTLFSFDFGSDFVNPTIRGMRVRLRDGADPNSTEARIITNITTGGGRTLPRDDRSWTLIAAC